jgi:MFS family permease
VPALPRRTLFAVAISEMVYTIVQGLSYPLLALLLAQTSAREWEIGINAAMVPLGMVAAGAGAPPLVRAIGARAVGMSSFGFAAFCLIAIKVVDQDPLLWMPLRFVMGFALACIFVVTDTWINELTSDESRGRVLGLYSVMLSVGFAIGPGILAVVGSNGWTPFIAGAGCSLAALVPLLVVWDNLPEITVKAERRSGRSFLTLAPLLLLGVGVVALSEQATMSLLPVWALAQGFDTRTASIMLVVMSVGSIALTFPIGWLADRVSRRLLTTCCAAVTAGCASLLSLVGGVNVALWPILFVFGGAYYAIYVLSLIRLGERFSGQLLVAGTAAFGAAWGLGGIVGPPLVGGMMTRLGPLGLPIALTALFGTLVIVNVAPRIPDRG